MSTNPPVAAGARALDDPGVRRMLRFTIAVTLSAAIAYAINWSFSFITVALVTGFMMTPMPAPSLRLAIEVLARLYFWLLVGLVLILPIHFMPVLGLALVALLIFAVFYADAQGKTSPLDGTLVMLAVLVVGLSGTAIDASVAMAKGIVAASLVMFPVVWIAYALLPAPIIDRMPKKPALAGGTIDRALYALRPVLVVMPILVFLLASDNATRYMVVAMKGAQVAEQASIERARAYSADINVATIVGSLAGLLIYALLGLWPSLLWYLLLIAMSMLYFGWQMTRGPGGVSPDWYRWGYAASTSIILLAPVLLKDDFSSDDPNTRFYLRVFQFLAVTVYASAVLYLFDGAREWIASRRKAAAVT